MLVLISWSSAIVIEESLEMQRRDRTRSCGRGLVDADEQAALGSWLGGSVNEGRVREAQGMKG